MTRLLITGESHIGPLRRGLDLLSEGARSSFVFWPLGGGHALRASCHSYDAARQVLTTTSPKWNNRIYSKETIGSIGADTIIFLSLPLNTSRILRDYDWAGYAPHHLAIAEAPLSDRVVESLIDADSGHALRMTMDLARVWPRLVVIEAPRFFANANYLQKHRLEICQYVDASYRKRVAAKLAEAGIPILAQPEITITELGTTDLTFDHEDPADQHHANAQFGKLVLERMLAYAAADA